jgi:hypothetical protein
MSLVSALSDDRSAASASPASAQAPKLRLGSYAVWKVDMHVHLQRSGAEGVHTDEVVRENWTALNEQVLAWRDSAMSDAMAAIGVSSKAKASASASSSGKASGPTEDQRKMITARVNRSHHVYGIIWAVIPEELRLQSAHIPSGCAPALWLWLQQKFQNTEQDSVGDLFRQWVELHHNAGGCPTSRFPKLPRTISSSPRCRDPAT